MFSTINTCIFILTIIYTFSGSMYMEKEFQDIKNTDETINNESTIDNSTNGHWYSWLVKNLKSLSIGIYTLALFIFFNLISNNGKHKFILDNFKNSPATLFMFSFNIIFLFYYTDLVLSNIYILFVLFCYILFKQYCNLGYIDSKLLVALVNIFKSICPPPFKNSYICIIYWLIFSLILINIILVPLSNNEIILYINTTMAFCVLIFITILIFTVSDCKLLFGI